MSEENSQNFSELEFKEQLYVFYLEIKGELTKKKYRNRERSTPRNSQLNKS